MVAKSPPKQKKMVAAAAAAVSATLNPVLVRETLNKVEMCMNRLQELQFTVNGGNKVVCGVSLSPSSTRTYLKTSLKCKHQSLRIKNGGATKSPMGKFPPNPKGEWQRMSLPAMLVGETIGEILTATKFARQMVEAVTNINTTMDDPKTPLPRQRNRRPNLEDSELRAKRKREKQRMESHSPLHQRVRSRINFKVVSPPTKRDVVVDKENARYMANRVSPRNRPWTKKAVLFPNPLFLSSDNPQQQQPKFCRTKSPVITKSTQQTPHKFLIKSPLKIRSSPPVVITRSPPRLVSSSKLSPKRSVASKLHRSFSPLLVASKNSFSPARSLSKPAVITRSPPKPVGSSRLSPKRSAASKLHRSFSPSRLFVVASKKSFSPARFSSSRPVVITRSPPRAVGSSKLSPKRSAASKLRRSFSPSRLLVASKKSFSPARMTASKLRQSFSPSRLAARLVSPLKSRKSVQKFDEQIMNMSDLKKRPANIIQMRV